MCSKYVKDFFHPLIFSIWDLIECLSENDKFSLGVKEMGAELTSLKSKETGFEFIWDGNFFKFCKQEYNTQQKDEE